MSFTSRGYLYEVKRTNNRFNIEPLSHATVQEARDLLQKYGKEYGLRILDALHLGCFNLISDAVSKTNKH